MDVLRPPCVVMISPRISAGPYGDEAIVALSICKRLSHAREVWIQWRIVLIALVEIASRGIGLPNLNQRIANRPAILIEYSPADYNSLAEGLASALPRQVESLRLDNVLSKTWASHFRKCIGKKNQPLFR